MGSPGRPPIDPARKVYELLDHVASLDPAVESPITHYRESVNANFTLIRYIGRSLSQTTTYPSVRARHTTLLNRFVLADLIQTFERFHKALAAACIDHIVHYVTDDRFDGLSASGAEIVAHFQEATIGKALCESDTWLNNAVISSRFRKILRGLDGKDWDEFLYPGPGQMPKDQRERTRTLSLLWQVRHNLAHNGGVITGSDAMKFRVLSQRSVPKDRILAPVPEDLRYVKRFLTETAESTNERIARRLETLLGEMLAAYPGLFDATVKEAELVRVFDLPIAIPRPAS